MNPVIARVTDRIIERSAPKRGAYLSRIAKAAEQGPRRGHLSCGNLAHAVAAMGPQKDRLAHEQGPNLGIVTAYNDMLSAHQPFAAFPHLIKQEAQAVGATAQVAGGVPAMCDGVTQGQPGMELSLFSRDVIAMAAAVALSHDTFDAAAFLGVCDKIVPGLVIAALSFGHLPAVFLPAGPMPSGIPNDEKAAVRQKFAQGLIDQEELMQAEMASYHAPGTCTFYGTANSNQMLMEVMGLHLPGASFLGPGETLRAPLTRHGTAQVLARTALGDDFMPVGRMLDERSFVNGIVGLMATGGSTNLLLHLPAMAAAGGITLTMEDFAEISAVTPLLARVYPNGVADVNHFAAAGGLPFLIRELLDAGMLHEDVQTIAGDGLRRYTTTPVADGPDGVAWEPAPADSGNADVLRPAATPFQPTGGLARLRGSLGTGVIKVSAVKPEHHIVEAPAAVFEDQEAVVQAFRNGDLDRDVVVVVRFQGPKANGMPELHGLTPSLSTLQARGHKVALVTDGRMSGASGKVPAAIHMSPEALSGGPLSQLRDGDVIRLDATAGTIEVLGDLTGRSAAHHTGDAHAAGYGRELFATFRGAVGSAETGASALLGDQT